MKKCGKCGYVDMNAVPDWDCMKCGHDPRTSEPLFWFAMLAPLVLGWLLGGWYFFGWFA